MLKLVNRLKQLDKAKRENLYTRKENLRKLSGKQQKENVGVFKTSRNIEAIRMRNIHLLGVSGRKNKENGGEVIFKDRVAKHFLSTKKQ